MAKEKKQVNVYALRVRVPHYWDSQTAVRAMTYVVPSYETPKMYRKFDAAYDHDYPLGSNCWKTDLDVLRHRELNYNIVTLNDDKKNVIERVLAQLDEDMKNAREEYEAYVANANLVREKLKAAAENAEWDDNL